MSFNMSGNKSRAIEPFELRHEDRIFSRIILYLKCYINFDTYFFIYIILIFVSYLYNFDISLKETGHWSSKAAKFALAEAPNSKKHSEAKVYHYEKRAL